MPGRCEDCAKERNVGRVTGPVNFSHTLILYYYFRLARGSGESCWLEVIMFRYLYQVLLLAGCLGLATSCFGVQPQDEAVKKVMASPLAGSWYSDDPVELAKEIDGYLQGVPARAEQPVAALILPHAGLRWSGQAAAYGLKLLAGRDIQRVIVLGPSHQYPLVNSASLPEGISHYATPLGEIRLDSELIGELRKSHFFTSIPAANNSEHSVQVLLPMLQRVCGDFSYVPIVLGSMDVDAAKKVAEVLRPHIDVHTLVIASTDFTHYGAAFAYLPFTDDIQENLEKLDLGAFALLKSHDLEGFTAYVERTGATICGRAALEVLLALIPTRAPVELLHYTTSAATTGDFSHSVSYISAAVIGSWPKVTSGPSKTSAALSAEDRQELLTLAKVTLRYYLEKGKEPSLKDLGITATPGMRQVMGVFVTLKKHHELRGCIGEITPYRPLYQAVMARVIDAAVHDPRFLPVSPQEYDQLEFEISALTPTKPVASAAEIVLGRDGIVLSKNGRSAVFLPQVAPEQGWGLEETLTQLALKAGLGPDDWRQGASFTVFQAIVFGEGN
jgi:AmmeMemoRadiSam system protein B/AmmeMemoRadiSam system protein A